MTRALYRKVNRTRVVGKCCTKTVGHGYWTEFLDTTATANRRERYSAKRACYKAL